MKTNELTGAALDWAVAKCEGENSVAACYYDDDDTPLWLEEAAEPEWKPSTNWSQGGPIVERKKITVQPVVLPDGWMARTQKDNGVYEGPTPLIAAMRCYVASKLGDTVEVPDELA